MTRARNIRAGPATRARSRLRGRLLREALQEEREPLAERRRFVSEGAVHIRTRWSRSEAARDLFGPLSLDSLPLSLLAIMLHLCAAHDFGLLALPLIDVGNEWLLGVTTLSMSA